MIGNQVCVAVLGAGKAGFLFGKAVNASANGRLGALVAETAEEAKSVGAALDQVDRTSDNWREVVESDDIEAVFIATPTFLHAEMTIGAAKAGKHVLCDKPLCLSVAESDAMIAACESAGVLLMVGFLERFNPAFRVVKERIRTGKIGRPVMVSSRRAHPPRHGSWIMDDTKSGGAFLHTGCHNIDLVQWLFDSPLVRIAAEQVESGISPGFTDVAAVIGRLESGVLVNQVESYAHPPTMPMGVDRSFEILGTHGSLYLDLFHSPVTLCNGDGWKYEDVLTWVEADGRLSGALTAETEYFLDCVLSGTPPVQASGPDGRRTIAVFEAARRAVSEGRQVDVAS
jgi:myo-inositol 2-dehydrogenase/D-chiro-inositol 1-dehydrogenase